MKPNSRPARALAISSAVGPSRLSRSITESVVASSSASECPGRGVMVTPKLPALLAYQLSLRTPGPPSGSVDHAAAARGGQVFRGVAGCATCHQGPTYTDVLSGPKGTPLLHAPAETGVEPFYAARTATGQYRTTPLRALWQHAPYFHDGSAATLMAVVEHYDRQFGLHLDAARKADLVEFLKSL